MKLRVVPVDFADACEFVAMWHRHLKPPAGYKFAVGVAVDATLIGVAIVGRPSARYLQDGRTLEVTRTATDGTHNANSMLYGASWRATKALGYTRLITYTRRDDESGVSLRAAGFRVIAERPARPGWTCPSRPRVDHGADNVARFLWEVA